MKQRNKNEKTLTQKPEPAAAQHRLEQLRKRAQGIFEARGSTPGHELDAWILADIELYSRIGVRAENVANGKENP